MESRSLGLGAYSSCKITEDLLLHSFSADSSTRMQAAKVNIQAWVCNSTELKDPQSDNVEADRQKPSHLALVLSIWCEIVSNPWLNPRHVKPPIIETRIPRNDDHYIIKAWNQGTEWIPPTEKVIAEAMRIICSCRSYRGSRRDFRYQATWTTGKPIKSAMSSGYTFSQSPQTCSPKSESHSGFDPWFLLLL